MKTTQLGQTGPEVSRIALGCMSFAGFYGPTNRDETFACLDAAKDAGINFLDTAEIYGTGLSETLIGDYQRETGHKFHIATKGGIVIGGKRGDTDNSEPYLRRSLEESLKRLQTDHVALYYIHRRDWSIPVEAVAETLAGFQKEGLIGQFGFSEIAPSTLRRASKVAPVGAVQNEYSLWTRYPELGLIQACAELGTTFVPFCPLARGMLADNFPDPQDFTETDFRKNTPRFTEPNFSANCAWIEGFQAIARDKNVATSALALAWVLAQDDRMVPIPGTRSAAHLEEWADASDIELTAADMDAIARALPPGFAHGDRYSDAQIVGIERYC